VRQDVELGGYVVTGLCQTRRHTFGSRWEIGGRAEWVSDQGRRPPSGPSVLRSTGPQAVSIATLLANGTCMPCTSGGNEGTGRQMPGDKRWPRAKKGRVEDRETRNALAGDLGFPENPGCVPARKVRAGVEKNKVP